MFGTILISVCTVMHIYVFGRAASVPLINRHLSRKVFIGAGVILWAIFVFARLIGHGGSGIMAGTLELLGMNWLAVLFLIFIPLLAIDLVTLFGFLIPRVAPALRGWALAAGMVLSLLALVQGMRPPVVTEYEVSLPGLPEQLDGTVLVALADLHLGSQLDHRWLAARIAQIQAQRPDLVVLLGDIFEGHGPPEEHLLTTFKQLSPPLGVWAVPGNHEFHHGGKEMHLFARAGIKLLRNEWAEARPNFILAGVDDLTASRRHHQAGGDPIPEALKGHPAGASILLSHTPWQADRAAAAKVGLMLCGHTHGGQIWPFNYLVRQWYPLLAGRYEVDGTTVIVSRGTGTWGPRMRLWHPGEILRVKLRTSKIQPNGQPTLSEPRSYEESWTTA